MGLLLNRVTDRSRQITAHSFVLAVTAKDGYLSSERQLCGLQRSLEYLPLLKTRDSKGPITGDVSPHVLQMAA